MARGSQILGGLAIVVGLGALLFLTGKDKEDDNGNGNGNGNGVPPVPPIQTPDLRLPLPQLEPSITSRPPTVRRTTMRGTS